MLVKVGLSLSFGAFSCGYLKSLVRVSRSFKRVSHSFKKALSVF
ncbi:hypothetical protein HPHPA14_1597 [Helicobacter pylori Hp A-14]|nr:hypothetical protein HPHPA14_1597 [Helicobacter pylori Hp A-14]